RRPRGALWRADGRDRAAPPGRLQQDQAGGAGRRGRSSGGAGDGDRKAVVTAMSYFDDEQKPSRRLWAIAATVALALHLGGAALAFGHLKTDDNDDGLGANGAEFAVELESPKVPDDNLPPGPDADAQQASQAQNEQKAEPKETELPTDKPQESEDPDRVVSENNSQKPKEDD